MFCQFIKHDRPFYIGHFTFNLGPSIQLAALSKTGLQPIRTVQIKNKIVAHPVNTPTMTFLAFLSTNYHHFPKKMTFFWPYKTGRKTPYFSLEFHVFSCFFHRFLWFCHVCWTYRTLLESMGIPTCFALEFHVFHVFLCFFMFFHVFSCFPELFYLKPYVNHTHISMWGIGSHFSCFFMFVLVFSCL